MPDVPENIAIVGIFSLEKGKKGRLLNLPE